MFRNCDQIEYQPYLCMASKCYTDWNEWLCNCTFTSSTFEILLNMEHFDKNWKKIDNFGLGFWTKYFRAIVEICFCKYSEIGEGVVKASPCDQCEMNVLWQPVFGRPRDKKARWWPEMLVDLNRPPRWAAWTINFCPSPITVANHRCKMLELLLV